ncbi:hypothetical protein [Calothrix sp. UHCC 0171]|uniref:hypothetical protein n=1 Tax=Calothrix sp. UHCC 0171 TaxID=3110245 RepID=UPI002B1F2DF2|nr:hypothetical protein [Calothrix sp. UHCC 0171]MEA5573301.1 hypothetical protein [Calothrix sp. UHCC 0171]
MIKPRLHVGVLVLSLIISRLQLEDAIAIIDKLISCTKGLLRKLGLESFDLS